MTKNNKEQPVAKTVAEEIWDDIKDRNINLFALSGQKVSDYCLPAPIEPSKCFLLLKASSALPAIEELLSDKFVCEVAGKYVVVSRK